MECIIAPIKMGKIIKNNEKTLLSYKQKINVYLANFTISSTPSRRVDRSGDLQAIIGKTNNPN